MGFLSWSPGRRRRPIRDGGDASIRFGTASRGGRSTVFHTEPDETARAPKPRHRRKFCTSRIRIFGALSLFVALRGGPCLAVRVVDQRRKDEPMQNQNKPTIVVGVDYSDTSVLALKRALTLARGG